MAFSIPATGFVSHLNCSICVEVFSDPRALPCMHTFCRDCLQSYITCLNRKTDIRSRGFECPVCRNVTYSPIMGLSVEKWADNFTPNYTVKGLVDEHNENVVNDNSHAATMEDDRHRADVNICGVHVEKVAEFKCEDHSPVQVLCALCALRKHKRCKSLIYIGEEHLSSSEDEYMATNGDIDLTSPVTRHRALSRRAHLKLCAAQEESRNYNEHLTEKLAYSDTRNREAQDKKQGLSHPNSHQSLRRLFKNQHSHSFEDCDDLRKLSASAPPYELAQAENRHLGLHHMAEDRVVTAPPLDMLSDSNEDDNETRQTHSTETPSKQIDNGRESHPSLRRLARGTASHSFNDSDDLRRLSEKRDEKNKTKNSGVSPDIGFPLEAATSRSSVPKSRSRSALKKEMSIITEAAEEELSFSSDASESHLDLTLSLRSTFTLSKEVNVRLPEDSKTCCVTGICSMPNGRALLADNNNYKVKLFDDKGTFRTYITLPSEPWDVDCIGDYEAVVTLPNAMCMFTLIVDSKVTVGRRIDVDRKCYGVVFHDMNFIIACASDIRIFSYNGEFLTRILKDKKTMFTNPRAVNSNLRYLCIDKVDSNKIYISDRNRGLVCINTSGEVVSFNSSSNSPQGLISSDSGILIVCQDSNRVTLFQINEHGCCTKDVLSVENVQNADINKCDGRLWLSKSDNDIINMYTIKM